jgi:hypothetical protein
MIATNGKKIAPFPFVAGKPRILHLLRCQGIAVAYFTLGRLETAASSTFATLG